MTHKVKVGKNGGIVKGLKSRGEGHPHGSNGNGAVSKPQKDDPQKDNVLFLEQCAQSEYFLLLQSECQRTEQLWRLGDYLRDIRRLLGLTHGMWQKYLEDTLHIDYLSAKRACRLRKRHDNCDDVKGKTLEEALAYEPSPNVKAAKRAKGRAKTGGKPSLPGPEEKPPTDEEKQALKFFLDACGTVERARFVLETVTND